MKDMYQCKENVKKKKHRTVEKGSFNVALRTSFNILKFFKEYAWECFTAVHGVRDYCT